MCKQTQEKALFIKGKDDNFIPLYDGENCVSKSLNVMAVIVSDVCIIPELLTAQILKFTILKHVVNILNCNMNQAIS